MAWNLPFIKASKNRAVVWEKTNGRCWYCGKQTNPWRDFCIDHVIDGLDTIENVVPCCSTCNRRKSNKGLDYLRRWIPIFYFEREMSHVSRK